ncbi:MAG: transcriptional repressor, partial [Patescibacteria group bacterium]|nr:transcriptional repressor [Patescibacteria group bacterium]
MNNKRRTKQKTAILEYLRSVKTHPTAEAVYSALKNKISNLSLGTVYRNLSDFKKEGLLKEIELS